MATQFLRNGWFGKAAFSIGLFSMTASWSADANLGAALVGLAGGHLFDLWARGELLTTLFAATRSRTKSRTNGPAFMQLTFTGLGDLSRTRPDLREAYLTFLDQLSTRLHLDNRARRDAKRWFVEGSGPDCDFSDLIMRCADGYTRAPLLANMALECFCSCALLDGTPNRAQRLRLDAFAAALGAPTNRVRHLLRELTPIVARKNAEILRNQTNNSGTKATLNAGLRASTVEDLATQQQAALTLFKLSGNATAAEIKQAYRRFVAEHHPDKLPKESSTHQHRQAEHNMQQAQDALALLQSRASE